VPSTLLRLDCGTGTVIRPETLRRDATDAGFSTIDALAVEHAQFVLYRLA